MTSMARKTILVCIASVAISGCASNMKLSNQKISEVNALQELKDISIEARHELRILAKAQESASMESMTQDQHDQRFYQATYVPEGFEKRLDFSYTGPTSKAAEAVAKIAGYKFHVTGSKSAHEPWVSIHLKDQPLNDALKEIGMATGNSIRLEVHPPAKLIRFIYKT